MKMVCDVWLERPKLGRKAEKAEKLALAEGYFGQWPAEKFSAGHQPYPRPYSRQ